MCVMAKPMNSRLQWPLIATLLEQPWLIEELALSGFYSAYQCTASFRVLDYIVSAAHTCRVSLSHF